MGVNVWSKFGEFLFVAATDDWRSWSVSSRRPRGCLGRPVLGTMAQLNFAAAHARGLRHIHQHFRGKGYARPL